MQALKVPLILKVGYRRFPTVKIDNMSKSSVGTENERNFWSGATSYNEIAENMTQELPIYTEILSMSLNWLLDFG